MSLAVGERLSVLADCCRQRRIPVIFTRHVHQHPLQDGGAMARWWRSLIIEGTADAEFTSRICPQDGDRVISKCRYSAFLGTPLELMLHSMKIEDLIIGGVMTNLCCETTARDAFTRDFNVFFLGDGTATTDMVLQHASLKNIAFGFGRVLSVAEAIQTLQVG
jgi:isochorismate hydrolase